MCGIAGIIAAQIESVAINNMLGAMAHRGPDGSGVWNNEYCSLGHLRLSIIDLTENGSQPMHCKQSNNVIVFNGEIYNYIELRKELQEGYSFSTDSDTEVILAAYLKWGESFLCKLRGMFALALYDSKKRDFIIARDRVGIKPLYYNSTDSQFVFASEIKSILAAIPHLKEINYKSVLRFQTFRHLDTDSNTFFKDIRQLEPGSFMRVGQMGQIKKHENYWQFPDECGMKSFDENAESEFKEKLIETVRIHLRSDVKVGSFLSGGLDSTTLAFIADKEFSEKDEFELFSYLLSKQQTEENALIPSLQLQLKGISNNLYNEGENFFDIIDKVIFHHDEPLPDASMFIHFELCRLAKQRKVKVLLSGSGGDELLGGYQNATYSLFGKWLSNFQVGNYAKGIKEFQTSRYESRSNIILKSVQEILPFRWRELQKQSQLKEKSKYWSTNIDFSGIQFYYNHNNDPWIANYLNCYKSWTAPPYLHYEDRNSMAFGIEIRVPFYDHELIELTAKYNPADLISGISKNVLRKSMKGIVPAEVLQEKSKHGFPAPLSIYTKYNIKKSREYYLDNVKTVPFYDYKKLETLCENFLLKDRSEFLDDFWRTLSISIWYNKFFNAG
jgi:asparagine synthase (glutamine-hydrolysing)